MTARTHVLPRAAAAVGCALVLALMALMAPRVEATELGAKQAALVAEREAVLAEHAKAVQACRSRFAVTPCIESADEVRRRALQRIQSQEWAIEEALRLQRTEERRLQREARAAEHARRAVAAPVSASAPASASAIPLPSAASAAASGNGPPAERRRGAPASAPAGSGEAREAEARRRAERLSQRQEELAQRQARIQAREAQRAASGARGEPLPRP
jgi:hypothetical protein